VARRFQAVRTLIDRAHMCQSSNVARLFMFCPADPEEAADAYLLRRMAPGEVENFELHLAGCSRCSQIVETTRAFTQALRDAAHDVPKTRAATSN
jgi:hypothetical protein